MSKFFLDMFKTLPWVPLGEKVTTRLNFKGFLGSNNFAEGLSFLRGSVQ